MEYMLNSEAILVDYALDSFTHCTKIGMIDHLESPIPYTDSKTGLFGRRLDPTDQQKWGLSGAPGDSVVEGSCGCDALEIDGSTTRRRSCPTWRSPAT